MYSAYISSLSRVQLFVTPWATACQASCPSPTPRVHPNSCPLSWWCHPTISSSVVPFSSHHQSFPAWGSFQMSQFFASGGQSIGASASASIFPMNIQVWFPLGLTGLISFLSKALCLSDLAPWIYFSLPLNNGKRFDLGHTWMLALSTRRTITCSLSLWSLF